MSQNRGFNMAMRPSQTQKLTEREKAQLERAKLRRPQNEEKITNFPVFSPPRRTTEKDDRIEKLLGPHHAILGSLAKDTDLLGITSQPQTPLPNQSSHDRKFFRPHHRTPESNRNGIRPSSGSIPFEKHSKPNSSCPEPSKNCQNQSSRIYNADHQKSRSSHYSNTSNSHPQLTKTNDKTEVKNEPVDSTKFSKPTKHSSHSRSSRSPSSDRESNRVKSTQSPSPKPSPSDKPKPLGNSTKQFTPPNGVSRPQRKQLEKLRIPSGENDSHKDVQSVDDILQEMTNLQNPLTAISTPQKDDHFPFPHSMIGKNFKFPEKLSQLKLTHKDNKLEDKDDTLDIPLVRPIEPLITPPETPIKPPAPKPAVENHVDVNKDLVVSDDSDEEDEIEEEKKQETNTLPDGPSRKDPCKGTRAPVKEPRSVMSSDSSSSESGNDSDSSSDDSNSSSDDDDDEEEEKVNGDKSPSTSPALEKSSNSHSHSWKLEDLMKNLPGDKYPKPSSAGSAGSGASDDCNDNDDLLTDIVQTLISPGESFTHSKSPNSIQKSPQQPHSHSSSHGDFHHSSPRSVQSTPSKSSLLNGITPSKKTNLHSDNSDSEIDVVNTPIKKVSLKTQNDQRAVARLNFSSGSHSDRQPIPKHRKRQSSERSILGSLSSSDDSDDESHENINNNDMTCNIQEIIHSLGTKHAPLSPILHDPEKIPRCSPHVKKAVNRDALKYNDGKPSIVVRLNLNNLSQLIRDKFKKSPYRDKTRKKSQSEVETLNSSYPIVNSSPVNVLKSPYQDTTANTEPVEMELDTDSEMANSHIEDYTVNSVSSVTSEPNIEKCWQSSDKISIKRKQNETEKSISKKRKSTPKTTNKSTETAQKEKDSHEDDHKWDRKHPHRSSDNKDPLSNSSSSSHTDTEKPSEFELVEELNGQTNSDAHPSSVETIFNREGDGEITHEPIIRKPVRRPDEPLDPSEVYRSRARELKHQADELAKKLKYQADNIHDKIAMYLLYTESMSCFILCGCAMEKEERKATDIYRMYSDTFNLISHICRIRHSAETSDTERKLAVLIYRIQAILCFKLYKLKKTEALKFKKVIDDHNKSSSSKQPSHAPSPHWNNRSTPSPMSPSPSPAGSVGSVGSQESCGNFTPSKILNGNISSQPAMSSPGTVAVPQRIHSITQQYLSIVSHVVQCHEFWDQAENAYNDHKEFYEEVDDHCGSLTLHSSVPDLVYYVQTGLQKIKDNT